MAILGRRTSTDRKNARLKFRKNHAADDILDLPISSRLDLQNHVAEYDLENKESEINVELYDSICPYDTMFLRTESEVTFECTQFEGSFDDDDMDERCSNNTQIRIGANLTLSAANLNASALSRDFGEISKKFLKWLLEVADDYPRLASSVGLGIFCFLIGWLFFYWLRNYLMGWVFWFVEVLWPLLHIWFRSAESMSHSAGHFFQHLDDIGQSMFCDLAEIWCHHYNQMCSARCTFTELALERMRKNP